jgi:hypothetical protein
MKEFIRKLLKESILDEADYPNTFNIEEFKGKQTFKDRIKYIEERLTKLGAGSSRIVYQIDPKTVLKLAKNKKGVAQNKVEIEYSHYGDLSHLFAEVFEYDSDGLWVEMELASKVTNSNFKTITGIDFKTDKTTKRTSNPPEKASYVEALQYYYYENVKPGKNPYGLPEGYKELWEDEFMYDAFSFVGNYRPPLGDLLRLSTYGVVKRNGQDSIVMIDYGLDEDVYSTHYSGR